MYSESRLIGTARVQLFTTRNDQFDQKVEQVKKVLGDLIGEETETEVVNQVTKLSDTMTWGLAIPRRHSAGTSDRIAQ